MLSTGRLSIWVPDERAPLYRANNTYALLLALSINDSVALNVYTLYEFHCLSAAATAACILISQTSRVSSIDAITADRR